MEQTQFKENVILVDADYVDEVAGNLKEYFRKTLSRDIPLADMADWLVCAALDGGVPADSKGVQCFFIHRPGTLCLKSFTPGDLRKELDGVGFKDQALGEFLLACLPDQSPVQDDFFCECVRALLGSKEVGRLVLVPDLARSGDGLTRLMAETKTDKQVTLLGMMPQEGFEHVMLGFSLLHAMGVKSEEIK